MKKTFHPLPFTLLNLFIPAEFLVMHLQIGDIYARQPEYQTGARVVLVLCLGLLALYTAILCTRMFSTGLCWFKAGARLAEDAKWHFSGLACAHGVISLGLGVWLFRNGRTLGLLLLAVDFALMAWIWLSWWPREGK